MPTALRCSCAITPRAARRAGIRSCCLHGLTRNSADFDGIAPVLAGAGRRVLALDARGRGRSGTDPDPMRYRADIYVGDVIATMDQLGIARAVFVGTSMGGLMTMLLAQRAPERVAAAVLNDAGPVVNPAGLARIARYLGKSGAFADWPAITAAIKATQGAAFPDADDAFWQRFAGRVAREEAGGRVVFAYDPAIAQNFGAPIRPALDPMAMFAALAAKPVLVLRGALSDILAPEGVAAMRAAKPDLVVAEIPNVGHAPTLDEPEALEAVLRFLNFSGRL